MCILIKAPCPCPYTTTHDRMYVCTRARCNTLHTPPSNSLVSTTGHPASAPILQRTSECMCVHAHDATHYTQCRLTHSSAPQVPCLCPYTTRVYVCTRTRCNTLYTPPSNSLVSTTGALPLPLYYNALQGQYTDKGYLHGGNTEKGSLKGKYTIND